jgi:hypothetical protein
LDDSLDVTLWHDDIACYGITQEQDGLGKHQASASMREEDAEASPN